MQLALDDSEMLISAAVAPAALPTADLMKENKTPPSLPPSPPLLRHRYRNSRISNQCAGRVSRTGGPEGTGCSRSLARCPNGPSGKRTYDFRPPSWLYKSLTASASLHHYYYHHHHRTFSAAVSSSNKQISCSVVLFFCFSASVKLLGICQAPVTTRDSLP